MSVVFYVSSHGYGHASRQAALIAELGRRRPKERLLARSQAPAWLLAPARRRPAGIDPGIVQKDSFTIDFDANLRAHERFAADWEPRVLREAAFLKKEGARLVVSDIAPLAFAAAAEAGVPAVGVGNFSWDVILEPYAAREPRWRPIVELYRRAYGLAAEYFRLPMSLETPAFSKATECPLLARRCELSAEQARRKLGIPALKRPLILASFGGLGRGPLDLSGGDDLSGFAFIGFGPAPRGLKGQWFALRPDCGSAAVEAMAACDAVLGKPGYGLLSEALAHGKAVALTLRRDYAESAMLIDEFGRLGAASGLSMEEFRSGRWKAALAAALAAAPSPVPCGGAAFLAGRLPSC